MTMTRLIKQEITEEYTILVNMKVTVSGSRRLIPNFSSA